MKQTAVCRKTPLSSLFPTNNGHTTNFFQRKTTHINTLSDCWFVIQERVKRFSLRWVFFVQIRGVMILQCTLEMNFVLNVNSVQCAFYFSYFQSKLKISNSTIISSWHPCIVYFIMITFIFFFSVFSFPKVSRARFYKGTKPKSLRSFPVRPTVWSFGASLSASLPCFFLLVNQCMPFKSIIAIFL